MSDRSKASEFFQTLILGALIWGGGATIFAIVEALTNTATGLYLPLATWSFVVLVYAILGTLSGLALGVLTFVWRQIPILPRVPPGPFLGALFLGGLLFVFVGIPLNTRALPDLLSFQGLVGNAVFAVFVFGIAVLFYFALRSRRGPSWSLTFAILTFWLGILLVVGAHLDTFVQPLALSGSGLAPFLALLAICVVLYFIDLWAVRAVVQGAENQLVPIAVLAMMVVIALGLVLRVSLWSGGATGPVPAGKPNVLWLVMDTTRADHLSTYGYERPTSPVLDELAAAGATFEEAHAESSWTIPGHFVMVTGRFDAAQEKLLGEEFVTAAEVLRDEGYDTGAVLGNMSLGRGSGFEQGFDDTVDGPVQIFYLSAFEKIPILRALMAIGIAPPDAVLRLLHRKTFLQNEAVRADAINEYALDWLDDRDPERPFFLFINYMDPHDSYDPPEEYREKFAPGVEPDFGFVRYRPELGGTISSNRFVRDVGTKLNDAQWQEMLDLYDAEIAYLDAKIGELLEALDERGLTEDTLVIITSDHGELFGEHGLANHFKALTREETHVPLILRYPAGIEGGQRIATPVQLRDIMPTVLELASASSLPEMDGRSLVPLLDGREEDSGVGEIVGFLYRPVDKEYDFTAPGHLLSRTDEDSQYVWSSTGMHEFYDLTKDPQANENRHGIDPAAAEAAAEFEAWRQASGFSDFGGKQKKVDRLMQDKLRALGYVN